MFRCCNVRSFNVVFANPFRFVPAENIYSQKRKVLIQRLSWFSKNGRYRDGKVTNLTWFCAERMNNTERESTKNTWPYLWKHVSDTSARTTSLFVLIVSSCFLSTSPFSTQEAYLYVLPKFWNEMKLVLTISSSNLININRQCNISLALDLV